MPLPVIAAIIKQKDRVLLCQRKEGALAGKWEFPGGKIEDEETPEQCLVREIEEELGIVVEVESIYQAVHSHYDHGDFLVVGYLANYLAGEIKLRVHSAYAWVHPSELDHYDLADANIPMARSLKEESDALRAGVGSDGGAD